MYQFNIGFQIDEIRKVLLCRVTEDIGPLLGYLDVLSFCIVPYGMAQSRDPCSDAQQFLTLGDLVLALFQSLFRLLYLADVLYGNH